MAIDILNTACFEYLTKLKSQLPNLELNDLKELNKTERAKYQHIITLLNQLKSPYDENQDYKTQYRKLHELAESLHFTSSQLKDSNLKKFHQDFFLALFENDNKIHSRIYHEIIQPSRTKKTSAKEKISRNQAELSGRPFSGIEHPEHAANRFFSGILGIAYHPLKKNNIPYISFGHPESGRKNLRFGAQVNGSDKVNKAFIQFLAVKKEKKPQKKFNHVYINLQKRDMKEGGKFERYFERNRSLALEELEKQEKLGIAVITLPADSHFFFKGFSHHTGLNTSNEKTKLSDLKNDIIDAIKNNKRDFYLSKDVKEIVFGDSLDLQVSELFRTAASEVLGRPYRPGEEVDPAVRQAIFFHFVKFHLTDHILKKIDPETYNISCKDNIDRGGVHNLWYEFMLTIKNGEKVSLEEFEKNLDASAILVKDRPMNEHRNVIWNMMYQAFTNNPTLFANQAPWVGDWLSQNIPLEKNLEKQLQSRSDAVHVSKNLKEKFAARLGKDPTEITSAEVIQLIQKDINERINNINKTQISVSKQRSNRDVKSEENVEVSSSSTLTDVQKYAKALESAFVGSTSKVREIQNEPTQQRFLIEQKSDRKENKVPPIYINHTKEESNNTPKTSFSFNTNGLTELEINNAVKALSQIALEHAKHTNQKTFNVATKGNKALAVALCVELNKHHLIGKLSKDEFSPQEQTAMMTEVENQKIKTEHRSLPVSYQYATEKEQASSVKKKKSDQPNVVVPKRPQSKPF